MQSTQQVSNPFALLLDPADVVARMECSERLRRLKSRVCRPLDKPLIPCATEDDFEPDAAAQGREGDASAS
jgi:hypothetical protein